MELESNTNLVHFQDMKDVRIPKFSASVSGHFTKMTFYHKRQYEERLFDILIFPCGHYLDSKDYVSIMVTNQSDYVPGMDFSSLAWTFSIINTDGSACLLYSFTKNDFFYVHKNFGLIRFTKRTLLVDRGEEFLPNDVLTIRCELTYASEIGPSAEGRSFFRYASKEELKAVDSAVLKECEGTNFFHVVLQLPERKTSQEEIILTFRKQFIQMLDLTDLRQVLERGSEWERQGYEEESRKRKNEVKEFLNIFYAENLFHLDVKENLKNIALNFLIIKGYIEDVSVLYGGKRSTAEDLRRQLGVGENMSSEEIVQNIFTSIVGGALHKLFEWNEIFHQNFEQSRLGCSVQDWEHKLEKLRYEMFVALENDLQAMFRFLLGLRNITEETGGEISTESSTTSKISNLKEERRPEETAYPFCLMLYLFFIFLVSVFFFETNIVDTFLFILYVFSAVMYLHKDATEEETRTEEETEMRTLVIETNDGKQFLIPFQEGALGRQLRNASPVFDRMLDTPMRELSERRVILNNINSATLDSFFYFIKKNSLKSMALEELLNLYEMADEFAVIDLMHACASKMSVFFTDENIDEIRAFAILHSDQNLLKLIDEFLSEKEYHQNFLYQ